MNGKIAFITGGSSDIGQSIIEKFLQSGVHVIAHYNHSPLGINHSNLTSIRSDLKDRIGAENLIQKLGTKIAEISYLVNCAAKIENKDFLDLDYADYEEIYAINLFSHIYLMQRVFQKMCENKFGRIVSLSSIGVKYAGSKNSMLYSSSKAALEAVTKSFAKFGAPSNVLCNNIRVGVIETKMHTNKNMSERRKLIPQGRFGVPWEIADCVLFLCSEKANFITGQDFAVSGGE